MYQYKKLGRQICSVFLFFLFTGLRKNVGVTPLRLKMESDKGEDKVKKHIKLTIDERVLAEYDRYYFSIHTKAAKRPIAQRPMMNALKAKWKDFIVWFIEQQGYTNLRIEKCELVFTTYFNTNRRHDVDNTCPKFILDGFCESGFIVDDDSSHILSLKLMCGEIGRAHV